MDSGFIDENGYVAVMARSDDVINVAGHRLSTGALEEVIPIPSITTCGSIYREITTLILIYMYSVQNLAFLVP